MIRLKQAVVVEGRYDKIKLENLLDTVIVTTNGFGIFADKEKKDLLRTLADKSGIIVMTDSDSAGNLIRRRLKDFLPADKIINVYVPQISGKEKRKSAPSKEGFLGVEGLSEKILLTALENAGITGEQTGKKSAGITKADMYAAGLSGCPDSAAKRREFLVKNGLPENLTCNALLEVINHYFTAEQAQKLLSGNDVIK